MDAAEAREKVMLFTISEVAAMLQCSAGAVRQRIWRGQLLPVRLGRTVRFRKSDIERALAVPSRISIGHGRRRATIGNS